MKIKEFEFTCRDILLALFLLIIIVFLFGGSPSLSEGLRVYYCKQAGLYNWENR